MAAVEPDEHTVDAHEDTLLRDEEARARAATHLTLHDNGDGTLTGRFTIPTLHGHLLQKVLETITAPRRTQARTTNGHTDWPQARGQAFCELLEHLPTGHLHPRTAATIVVTLDESSLRDGLKAARLDTGEVISAGQARRLACGAGIIPAVLDGASQPLDLGRSKRLTEAQRTALGLRHDSCAAHGCERPFSWCELHHHQPWSRGGPTDLDQAIPLCHYHHQCIHDTAFNHT